jgi:hypothetical protein
VQKNTHPWYSLSPISSDESDFSSGVWEKLCDLQQNNGKGNNDTEWLANNGEEVNNRMMEQNGFKKISCLDGPSIVATGGIEDENARVLRRIPTPSLM